MRPVSKSGCPIIASNIPLSFFESIVKQISNPESPVNASLTFFYPFSSPYPYSLKSRKSNLCVFYNILYPFSSPKSYLFKIRESYHSVFNIPLSVFLSISVPVQIQRVQFRVPSNQHPYWGVGPPVNQEPQPAIKPANRLALP